VICIKFSHIKKTKKLAHFPGTSRYLFDKEKKLDFKNIMFILPVKPDLIILQLKIYSAKK